MSPNDPTQKKKPEQPTPTSLPEIDVGSEGTVDLGDLPFTDDASAIALAQLPEPPSGQSLTSWTEVIRRQRAAAEGLPRSPLQAVSVDAPSDKDILLNVPAAEGSGPMSGHVPRTTDTSEIPQGQIPVYTSATSEADIDIGRVPLASAESSEVGFDIQYPPSDAGGKMPLPALPLSHSDVGLGDDIPRAAGAPASGISGIDFGAEDEPKDVPGRSSILDVLLRESGGSPPQAEEASGVLNMPVPPPTPVRSAHPTLPTIGAPDREPGASTRPDIEMAYDGPPSGSGIDLGDAVAGSASDEDVDLYAEEAVHPPSLTDSGTLEISEEMLERAQRRAQELESSSVNLSSTSSVSEFDVSDSAAPAARGGSEEDIDLGLPPMEDEANSSMFHRRSQLQANQEAIAAEFANRRRRREEEAADSAVRRSDSDVVSPARDDGRRTSSLTNLIRGSILGLILGAGGVLAAYFAGAMPNRGDKAAGQPTDHSAELAQARLEADTAKKATGNLRDSLTEAGIDPDKPGDRVKALTEAKLASDAQVRAQSETAHKFQEMLTTAQQAEKDAREAEQAAKKNLASAEKAASDAKKDLADATKAADAAKAETVAATKAADAAKAETVAAKKAADEALAGINKSLQGAGIDPTKAEEGLKKLVDARTAAEAKEKDLTAKLTEAAKKETDLVKLAADAKKQADDAAAARKTSETTLGTIAERLVKAKFVADKPDAAGIVKGIDDALKAATTDATTSLRDELAKARAAEAKMKTELTAAQQKEADATRTAVAMKAEAQKLQDAAKGLEAKLAADTTKFKADAEKLTKEATAAAARAADAEKLALQEKANTEKLAAESSKLKTDNDRLAKDLDAVRELSDLIKKPAGTSIAALRPDPAKLADRFFGEGLQAFFNGNYKGAESAFRKAIQFRGDDARYHYLLGLALWMKDDTKNAEAAFEKGRDLESNALPSSRMVSAVLERIQGPARQAVNAYRP